MTVYLVGAGPGDPGLLTLRGRELLGSAEVVIYDRLGAAGLLGLAPTGAELVDVGKAPGRAVRTQEEINQLLVEHGRTGRAVVRLKGGDPFVFGRGGEEVEALKDEGIPFEVVPGVTSAIAAPSYAGIPVTHRGLSTHVTIVTGHEDPAKGRTDVRWEALGAAGGTIVVLMGAGHLAEITQRLMVGGLAPETPAAAVRWGTTPRQRTVRSTLGAIAGQNVESPAAIVVGDVASLDLGWFEHRPLFGRRVVVTRAREQASDLLGRLCALGAEVIELPAIEVRPLHFEIPDLSPYAWLVFTSANGAAAFFDALSRSGRDARALAGCDVAVIGPGTAAALSDRGIRADLVPERFVAESLVDAFPDPGVDHAAVLLARAAVARDALPSGLESRGYAVDILDLYETVPGDPDPIQLDAVRQGDADVITFTSSSTVTNFLELLGGVPDPQPAVVAIGPVTADTAREAGLRVDAVAGEHTIDGVIQAVVDLLGS